MKIDMTNVSMDMFTLLDPGEYVLVVTSAEEKTSKAGNQMIEVNFMEEQTGAKLRDYFVVSENSLPKLKNFLRDIGRPYEGLVDVLPFTWAGERVRAKIGVENYKKNDGTDGRRNKIGFYSSVNPPASAPAQDMPVSSEEPPF